MIDTPYVKECNLRRLYVERSLAIVTTAAQAPNDLFMNALENFIAGKLSLEELESNVNNFNYLKIN